MKKFTLFIVLLFCLLNPVFSQTTPSAGVTTIGSYYACPGTKITLALSISGSPDIAGLGLELDYDGTVLSFLKTGGTSNFDANLGSTAFLQTNQQTVSWPAKKLLLIWSSGDTYPYTINPGGTPGTGKICDITFMYYGGSTTISFNNSTNSGQQCEYTGYDSGSNLVALIDQPTASYYVNGSITDNLVPSSAGGTNPICIGSSSTLSKTGGTLGKNANYYWYTVSCGGTFFASGTGPVVTPTTSTTYWVRVEGTCSTTACVSNTIVVNSLSTNPTSISVSPSSSICSGTAMTYTVNGGSLGIGASWQWYSGSCGGTSVGNGSTLSITPTTSAIYFVRAEGSCNTTLCVSTSVTVNISSTDPTSVSVSPSTTVCSGTPITFTSTGGSLGVGSKWQWYSGSCGGTAVGTGSPFNITPTISANYYVRAEGPCNTTNCASASLTINAASIAATSVTGNPSLTICSGASVTLTEIGGSLGLGGTWQWYSSSCGVSSVGNGTALTVNPTVTTNYYVRAEGTCN